MVILKHLVFIIYRSFANTLNKDAKKIASSTYTDDINVISFKNTNNMHYYCTIK